MAIAAEHVRDESFDLREHLASARPEPSFDHKNAKGHRLPFIGLTAPVKPTLNLADYVDASKAKVEVPPALAPVPLPDGFNWGMLLNDQVGDCVIAQGLHSVMAFNITNGDEPPAYADADAARDYAAVTGWNPNDPSTDQGTDEGQFMAYWQNVGLVCSGDGSQHKIAASVAVDPTDDNMRHLAIYEFDVIQYAILLPVSWQGKSAWTGTPKDSDPSTQPGSWGGHGVGARAYDAKGRESILTWGQDLPADADSLDAYLVQASIVISDEMVNSKTGVSRCGVVYDDLMSDIKRLPPNPVE